jgi:hypothetical protein
LQFTSDSVTNLPWYEDAFAPLGLGPVPAPPLEPGLPNWTIYLDTDNNGKLDPGEPYTTTDVNGRYGFVNLQPGTYTVAEVQQSGWTEKGPAPVPPGTYSQTLVAGQVATGLDFGNQQNPPGPQIGPPPSSTPDQPPVFTSTAPSPGSATLGQVFLYNATATDLEMDYPLTFDLPVHPVGMAVDPQLGVVVWQPTPDQTGLSASVLLRVTDAKGSVALQSFTVNVGAADTAPIIISTPGTTGITNLPYRYQVVAQRRKEDRAK